MEKILEHFHNDPLSEEIRKTKNELVSKIEALESRLGKLEKQHQEQPFTYYKEHPEEYEALKNGNITFIRNLFNSYSFLLMSANTILDETKQDSNTITTKALRYCF